MIESLNDQTFYDVVGQDGIVVVDVYADWCQPCQRIMKILPNLATALDGVAKLYKANIDEIPNVSEIFGVRSIPTFIFFKNGAEVSRFTGVKTLAEIEAIVRSL